MSTLVNTLPFEARATGISRRALAPGSFAGADGRTPLASLLAFADAFGVSTPGKTACRPEVKRGKVLDTYLTLALAAQDGAAEVKLAKTVLPGFLTTLVQGLNDNWSVHLVDRARAWPNHRALPIRDGRSYAELDLNDADTDLFIGHPVIADRQDVKILVSWMQPKRWYVEVHNPTDAPLNVSCRSNSGWPFFTFDEKLDLPAGTSRVWTVEEK
jgi:hypothetical protein